MYRSQLLRGASAGAITLFALAELCVTPAAAQQALPTIDVGGRNNGARQSTTRAAGPATNAAAPATNVASSPAPGPAPVSIWSPTLPDGKPAFVKRWQLPNIVASVNREYIKTKINIVDTQDALKYVPGVWVRKLRGGTEGLIQSRTWGLSAARNLVYVDDLLISQLINNGHPDSQPRWGLVSPEEIERIDVLYGPYAAQYPGNSMGGVYQITTRMPEKLELTAKQTVAVQDYDWWGVKRPFTTTQTAVTGGDKIGNLSAFLAVNYQYNETQPLSYLNAGAGAIPNYPTGLFSQNPYGVPQILIGSGSISTENFVNGKFKLAYDFTPTIRGTYTLGVLNLDRVGVPINYLLGEGNPAWGFARPGFTIGAGSLQSAGAAFLRYQETALTNAVALRSNTNGVFDWDISASHFSYPYSSTRSPWSVLQSSATAPLGGLTVTGRDSIFTGTYWTLIDLKGIVRPTGPDGQHEISFGLHGDQFHSNNPVRFTTNWTAGEQTTLGGLSQSIANGTTRTYALWAQDAYKITPTLKATIGIRGETWKATDGYNQSLTGVNATATGSTALLRTVLPIFQPNQVSTRFSPKASLRWEADKDWTITGNLGMANRFPTVRELYNLSVTPGPTAQIVNPNPNLRPETSITKEINFERKLGPDGWARFTLFDDEVRDAIISNAVFVAVGGAAPFQANTNINVDRIRNSGFEIAAQKDNVLFKGLELFGSVDFVNSRVISFPGYRPTFPTSFGPVAFPFGTNFEFPWAINVSGKNVPGVPKWRWNFTATYRPDDNWAFTVGMRWQDRIWRTLANNDLVHGVFGTSDRWFMVDLHAHYKLNERWSFDAGIDNVNNYKFALFHPFPQRTYVFSAKYEYGTGKNVPGIFYTGDEAGLPASSSWFQPVAMTW